MSGTPSLFAGIGAQLLDNNGKPLSGGKLFTYLAGTTTPIAVYTSEAATTAHPNPIILDSAGRVPTGEIWLKEGDTPYYKFVVKTSTDVLIATYDFVPGTYNSEILENFIDSLSNTTNPLLGDNLVGFRQSNANGNLANAVGRTVHSKLQESISLRDFGAVGDGIADDTTALFNAVNASQGKTLIGEGLRYRITTPLIFTSDNFTFKDATIDLSGVPEQPGNDFILQFYGVQEAGVNLTASLLANSNVVTVGSTATFSVDEYVWVTSDTFFYEAIKVGQYAKVKSIDSATQLTLFDNVLYDFNLANAASISPLTTKKNIVFSNVKFIGAQANFQAALYLDICEDVTVRDCSFNSVDYTCVYVSRCVNFVGDGIKCRYSRATGLSYGVVFLNGCFGGTVTNGYSEDQRHYVATGSESNKGGVNLYQIISNNHVVAARNAGIDAHPPTDFYSIIGNTIEIAAGLTGTLDGIICQGLNCIIANNTVVNANRHAIFHQLFPSIGSGSSVISNNLIRNGGGSTATDSGINVVNQTVNSATLNGVVISGNVIEGNNDFHILVTAQTGTVSNVSISNNVTRQAASNTSCRVYSLGANISDLTITGNLFKSSGTQNLYLFGTVSYGITRLSITGNNISGGINGIRYFYVTNAVQINNQFFNNTNRILIDSTSTSVALDYRQQDIRYLTGSPTYTVAPSDEYIVANRATTITLTMPNPAEWTGRVLNLKTVQAQIVDSSAANVAPIGSVTLGTAILPATVGAWSTCKSDGTNWVIMARGT